MCAAAIGVLQAVPFLEAVSDQDATKHKVAPNPTPCAAWADLQIVKQL